MFPCRRPLLGLLVCLLTAPGGAPAFAFARCQFFTPEAFAALDWGAAEEFDQGEALLLLQGLMDAPDIALVPGGTLAIWALPVGGQVLIIRQTKPTTLCSDAPIDRADFQAGKLRALPRRA